MKKFCFIFIGVLYATVTFAAVGTNFQVDGVWYTVTQEVETGSSEPGRVKVGKIVTITNGYEIHPMNIEGHLSIPEEVNRSGWIYVVETIGKHAFMGSSGLVSVELPETVYNIEDAAFENCTSLEMINLDNVASISYGAFKNCIKLKNISFNKNNTVNISWDAFNGCTSLKELVFYSVELGSGAFMNCSALEKVTFMSDAKSDGGSNEFANCTSLTTVVFSLSGYNFDTSATFANCTSLRYVYFPIIDYLDKYTPKKSALTNIHPNAVLFVADGMRDIFENNTNWSSRFNSIVTLPLHTGEIFTSTAIVNDSLMTVSAEIVGLDPHEVGVTALKEYTSTDLIIPDFIELKEFRFAITEIKDSALRGAQITSLTLNENLKRIEKEAFAECVELKSLIIPKSVEFISNSFVGCKNISSVSVFWFAPEKVTIDQSNFTELPEDAVLNIPAGTLENYRSHTVWGRFPKIIEASPISLGCIDILKDGEMALPVCLRNEDEIAGLQFQLSLPYGISAEENDQGLLVTNVTNRTEDMLIMGRRDPDEFNAYNFVMISLSGKSIVGNNGEIMNVKLKASNASLGVYEASISDIYVSTSAFNTMCLTPSISEIKVLETYLGDCNNDGYIDVADLTGIVKFVLGIAGNNLIMTAADMDDSGVVEVNDYVALVNVILSQGNVVTRNTTASCNTELLRMLPLEIGENGVTELCITLADGKQKFTGVQLDLTLPEGMTILEDGVATGSIKHSVWCEQHNANSYRILCASMNNAVFTNDTILRIKVKSDAMAEGVYELTADNVVLSDKEANRYQTRSMSTELSVTSDGLTLKVERGVLTLTAYTEKQVCITLPNGMLVEELKLSNGTTVIRTLPRGVYLVNGRKVVL